MQTISIHTPTILLAPSTRPVRRTKTVRPDRAATNPEAATPAGLCARAERAGTTGHRLDSLAYAVLAVGTLVWPALECARVLGWL